MAGAGDRWWGSRSDFPWEEDALKHIRDQMPNAEPYRGWHTFTFTAQSGHVREVDAFIATPSGLYLVEIKSHPGRAVNQGATWLFRDSNKLRTIENPLHLTDRKCKELRGQLEWAARKLGLRIRIPYIQAAVFLSDPGLRCDFDEVQRAHVYGRDELTSQTKLPGIWTGLLGKPPRTAASRVDAAFSRQLPKLLDKVGIQGLRRHYKIGSYQLEPRAFDTGPTWEDYLAENTALPGDQPRRVRVYLSDREAPKEQREWARRAARREYLALQGISHEGIVRAEQFSDEHEAGPAIVFRHGRNWQRLDHFMAEQGAQLPVETRIEMVRQLAEALDHAHRRHLYHRALAARSVYVEMDGRYPRLRICDWQVSARPGGTSSPHTALASARATLLGSQVESSVAAYLAPEFGNPASDATLLDVFGLGALSYLILTGQPPAASATDLGSRLASERALVPSAVADQLSPAMDDLVKGATAATPSDRVESVREFLAYLDLVDEELTRPDQGEVPDLLTAGKGAKTPDGWEIQQVLGKGSTARALLMAKDGHERVYKVALTDAARTRLEHEAAQLRPLRDSHIVRFIAGPLTIGKRTVLILERAGEQTVGQYLRSQGRFPIGDLESLGEQLFQVAEFLESEGIWHRDIKPDNLAIRQPPKKGRRLVLFDFSLADTTTRATQAGTPPYLDPFLGTERRPEFDAAAERYAVAVTLHEMASGELPSWGDGVVEPRLLDVSEQLPQLAEDAFDPRLRERLVAFFSVALQRDAARRHGSLKEMAKGWGEVFRDLDQESRPATTPDTVDTQAATAAEARDLSAARVEAGTPLVAAGLSPRALSAAEDQLHVNMVGELVKIPAARVQRLRGVGLGPRNELLRRAREWRQHLQVAEQAPPSTGGKPGGVDPGVLSLDEVVAQLVPRPIDGNGADVLVTRLALGLPDAEGRPSPVPSWAPIPTVATHAALPPEYVSDLLTKARTRWTKSVPAVTKLRVTVREILDRHGRVMESRHLAAALLAERGCTLADDTARVAVAQACVRAAIVAEEHLENPRLARRRVGDDKVLVASVAEGDPSVPNEEELFDYAAQLGQAADRLVDLPDGPPLPGGTAARQQLSEVPRPDGMPVLADTDLMALAVGASSTAAMTARLELYPRTLSPTRALQLSQVASYLAHPGIEPEQLRERVLARFPDLVQLPTAPDLRKLLQDQGYRVEVVTGPDGRLRYETPGGTLVAAWSSSRGPTSLSRSGDADQDTEAWLKLRAVAERGGFLAVKTRWADAVAVTAALAALDGVTAVPVAKLFVATLREIVAARGKPRWETVLAADSADASGTAQAGFRRLVDATWERVGAHVRSVAGIAFLHDATPLARYDSGREFLTRLASAGRQSDEAPLGLWLLCPMQDPHQPALLDGHIVGALGDGEQVVIRPSAPPRTERRAS